MDIHQLRVFASVFRNRSFSKASGELYLSQPTVSDHIKSLETELECKLFDRLGRTIIPTKEAETLYGHSLELIGMVTTIKEAIGRLKKESAGELVIGASTIPGTYLMPSLIASFSKAHPSASFRIHISDSKEIVEKVLRHELLLGIVGSKLKTGHIEYIPLMEDELIALSSPSYTKKRSMALGELSTLPMILREEGSGTRKEVEKILETGGVALDNIKVSGVFGSTDAVKQAIKAGLGISIVSRLAVADELALKLLREIRITDLAMKRRLYLVTHKKRTLPRAYGVFSEHIRKTLSP